jgi:hypothetical protein
MSGEQKTPGNNKKTKSIRRTVLEISFIILLFYSNLLMAEFNHSGSGQKNGVLWAINDILTISNFIIAIILALSFYLIFEFLRNRL